VSEAPLCVERIVALATYFENGVSRIPTSMTSSGFEK
jgi:hypothetical protein